MTAPETAPIAEAVRSGIDVALPMPDDAVALRRIAYAHASACDEFVDAEDTANGVVCTLAFDSPAGPLGVVVRRLAPDAAAARPDVAALLGLPVLGVVRLESILRPEAPEDSLRAELLLTAIAGDVAGQLGGLACDDAGAVYAPDELARLAAARRSRTESATFRRAAAERAEIVRTALEGDGFGPIDLSQPIVGSWPSDVYPDVATPSAVAYVAAGTRLPAMTATRLLLAATAPHDAAGGSVSVLAFGPDIAARDRRVLTAAGIPFASDLVALENAMRPADGDRRPSERVRATKERDESIAFTDLDGGALADLIRQRALDAADSAAEGSKDGPSLANVDAELEPSDLPLALGRFGFEGALASFYYLDLEVAHPFLRVLLGGRYAVEALFGGTPRHALACELVADPNVSATLCATALERADAFAVSVFAEIAARGRCVVADAAGALFERDELLRLAAARLGRSAAWSERIALTAIS